VERAATLLGAAEAVDNGLGQARPVAAELLAAATAALPRAGLDAALARGRAMSRDEIRAYATS
jgi:hypothetical protein